MREEQHRGPSATAGASPRRTGGATRSRAEAARHGPAANGTSARTAPADVGGSGSSTATGTGGKSSGPVSSGAAAFAAGAAAATRTAAAVATLVGSMRVGASRGWPGATVTIGESPRLASGRSARPAHGPSLAGVGHVALRTVSRPVSMVTGLVERRPFDEGWFEHRGARLRFEAHGTGPRVVVLTHGILLDSQMNRRLAADLAQRGNHVLLLDLPGHGRSDKPRHATAHRMDLYASAVVALLDHLQVERAVVGGVSLGANVALHVAEMAPDRVAGLVVEMPVLEWAIPGAAFAFLPMLIGVRAAAAVVRPLAATVRRLPRTQVGALDSLLAAAGSDPEEITAVLHGVLAGPVAPVIDARRAMRMPALVVGHQLDAIHPFADAARLARDLPRARLVRARSVAELRLLPARLTDAIAAFVDEVWAGELRPAAGAARSGGTRRSATRPAGPRTARPAGQRTAGPARPRPA